MYQVQLCDPNAALKATVDRAFADKEEKQGQGGGGGGGNAVSITGNTHEQQKTLLGVLIGRSLETASNCADSARLWQVLLSLSHALSLFLALSLSLSRALVCVCVCVCVYLHVQDPRNPGKPCDKVKASFQVRKKQTKLYALYVLIIPKP